MTNQPFDIESEKILLGAMLLSPESMEKVASIVDAGSFSQVNAPIYLAMLTRFQNGDQVDAALVTGDLRDNGELEGAGGAAYVCGLTTGMSTGANAPAYAEKVRASADKRVAADAIKTALKKVSKGNGVSPYQAIDELIRELQTITGAAEEKEGRDFRRLASRVRDYVDVVDGTFYINQVYSDLGIKEPGDKANVRQTLAKLKGTVIQSYGNYAGCYRRIRGEVEEMDLEAKGDEELSLRLPLDLHNYVRIMPGNEIVITGDPDSGKTAFLLRTIRENMNDWDCHYFNSEMGEGELQQRLKLFHDFPTKHPHFHAYERSDCFEDVVRPGKYVLNVIDYLEITDEFYLIGKYLGDIYKNLRGAVALVAIQKRSKTSDLPLGAQRALEKPRLAISLTSGSKTTPNKATILKCKNRKTEHSMIGRSRTFKLIAGCEFRSDQAAWE